MLTLLKFAIVICTLPLLVGCISLQPSSHDPLSIPTKVVELDIVIASVVNPPHTYTVKGPRLDTYRSKHNHTITCGRTGYAVQTFKEEDGKIEVVLLSDQHLTLPHAKCLVKPAIPTNSIYVYKIQFEKAS